MEQGNVTVEMTQHQDFTPEENSQGLAQTEKLIPQSKVDDIVAHRVSREQARLEQKYKEREQSLMSTTNQSSAQFSQEQLKQIAEQAIEARLHDLASQHDQKRQDQAYAQMTNEFVQKIEAGKSKYSDFDEVLSEYDVQDIAQIVELANYVDNTVDVTYELLRAPNKLNELISAQERRPALAKKLIKDFSNAVKQNQQVSDVKTVREPLSQLKPSRGLDNGSMTVSDFRKMPEFRR